MSELPTTTKDDHSTQSELTNLRTYEAMAKEMFPDKGMEGRG